MTTANINAPNNAAGAGHYYNEAIVNTAGAVNYPDDNGLYTFGFGDIEVFAHDNVAAGAWNGESITVQYSDEESDTPSAASWYAADNGTLDGTVNRKRVEGNPWRVRLALSGNATLRLGIVAKA